MQKVLYQLTKLIRIFIILNIMFIKFDRIYLKKNI